MGFISVNVRFGGLAAFLVIMFGEFGTVLLFVGFGVISILVGLVVCFLVETRNMFLVEIIEAMERR